MKVRVRVDDSVVTAPRQNLPGIRKASHDGVVELVGRSVGGRHDGTTLIEAGPISWVDALIPAINPFDKVGGLPRERRCNLIWETDGFAVQRLHEEPSGNVIARLRPGSASFRTF